MMSSATALSNRLLAEAVPLRCTLDEQPSVDVAKGVLMTLWGYGESEAFADLHQAFQQHHLPLADLAGAVVALISHPETPTGVAKDATAVAHHRWGRSTRHSRTTGPVVALRFSDELAILHRATTDTLALPAHMYSVTVAALTPRATSAGRGATQLLTLPRLCWDETSAALRRQHHPHRRRPNRPTPAADLYR